MSPISSSISVPPSAAWNRPRCARVAPVNAPFSWPNSSDSSRFSAIALQLIATNGLLRRGLALVDRARQQLLAGAALAGDQHARIGAGDHVRLRELLFHHGAARDDLGAPVFVGCAEAGDAQRLLHLVEQLLLVDRLGEEAERAHLRGLHRIGNRAVRGEDDDLQSRPAVLQLLQQADAVHLVHAQVGDHEVGTEAAGGRERLRAALDGFDVVVLRAQADGQQAQQSRIVVDDQDAGLAFASLVQVGSCRVLARWRGFALVERALDVGDRIQLALGLVELLAQSRIFVDLGLQALGSTFAVRSRSRACTSVALQPCDFRPRASSRRRFAASSRMRQRALGRQQRLGRGQQLAQQPLARGRSRRRMAGRGEHQRVAQLVARRRRERRSRAARWRRSRPARRAALRQLLQQLEVARSAPSSWRAPRDCRRRRRRRAAAARV